MLFLRLAMALFAALGILQLSWADDPVIRAQDKIQVTCEEEPSLNRTYSVTDDGLVLLSFIGAVKVAGLSEVGAAELIRDELIRQRILKSATVTVKLLGTDSVPIRFVGAVKKNGDIPWFDGIRLSDVVEKAQPTPTADLSNVRIEARTGELIVVDFTKYQGSNALYNPQLRPGDLVTFQISQLSTSVYILGGVVQPGAFQYQKNMTVAALVKVAGGLTEDADGEKIRIERVNQPARFSKLTDLLQPGDRITVEFLPKGDIVMVMGGVAKPGSVPFGRQLKLTEAIRLAGGLSEGARPDKVKISRIEGGVTVVRTFDLKRIYDGYLGDIDLRVRDRIMILVKPQPAQSAFILTGRSTLQ